MERPVIFLQSLLVLVVTIQVTFACKCSKPRTMEQALCANETLIMAIPLKKGYSDMQGNPIQKLGKDAFTKYTMHLKIIYNKGSGNFKGTNTFPLFTKQNDCGVDLELNNEYYIAGIPFERNSLLVDRCDFVEPVLWGGDKLSHTEFEIQNDYLTGHAKVKC